VLDVENDIINFAENSSNNTLLFMHITLTLIDGKVCFFMPT